MSFKLVSFFTFIVLSTVMNLHKEQIKIGEIGALTKKDWLLHSIYI